MDSLDKFISLVHFCLLVCFMQITLFTPTQVTDSITGKKYAMKQLTRGDSSSITKELTILKSLNHPNILRFIGVIPTENSGINIITEFLDGGTLNTAICKKVCL